MIDRICSLLKIRKPALNTGLLIGSGLVVPTDGTAGWQTGAIFQHTDGSAGTAFYINEGTVTACDFNSVETPSVSSVALADLSDVGATVYTAGKILVADGDSYEEVAVSGDVALSAAGASTVKGITGDAGTLAVAAGIVDAHAAGAAAAKQLLIKVGADTYAIDLRVVGVA